MATIPKCEPEPYPARATKQKIKAARTTAAVKGWQTRRARRQAIGVTGEYDRKLAAVTEAIWSERQPPPPNLWQRFKAWLLQ